MVGAALGEGSWPFAVKAAWARGRCRTCRLVSDGLSKSGLPIQWAHIENVEEIGSERGQEKKSREAQISQRHTRLRSRAMTSMDSRFFFLNIRGIRGIRGNRIARRDEMKANKKRKEKKMIGATSRKL